MARAIIPETEMMDLELLEAAIAAFTRERGAPPRRVLLSKKHENELRFAMARDRVFRKWGLTDSVPDALREAVKADLVAAVRVLPPLHRFQVGSAVLAGGLRTELVPARSTRAAPPGRRKSRKRRRAQARA